MTIESAEEFIRLRSSEDPSEYERASHDDAPIDVWYRLISEYPDMRFWVAHNRSVPNDVLAVLARDPSADVRSRVADVRRLSRDLFDLLSRDDNEGVRNRVAVNKKCPRDILEGLLDDPWEVVRDTVSRRLAEMD